MEHIKVVLFVVVTFARTFCPTLSTTRPATYSHTNRQYTRYGHLFPFAFIVDTEHRELLRRRRERRHRALPAPFHHSGALECNLPFCKRTRKDAQRRRSGDATVLLFVLLCVWRTAPRLASSSRSSSSCVCVAVCIIKQIVKND